MKDQGVFGDPLHGHDEVVWQLQPVLQLHSDLLKEAGKLVVECVRGCLVLAVGDVHPQLFSTGDEDFSQSGWVRLTLEQFW